MPSLFHPATRPPQDPLERCHGRMHPNDSASEGRARLSMHTCAHTRATRNASEDCHPDRSGAQSSENPQVSFRTPVADRGLARWQSIIPRTQKPTKTQARWQSITSAALGTPLLPTEPRESCGCPSRDGSQPAQARECTRARPATREPHPSPLRALPLRHMNASASADGRLGSTLAGQRAGPVREGRSGRTRWRRAALQQASGAVLSLPSKETE